VGRLTATASHPGGLEALLRRDRGVVLASIALIAGLAWLYLWREWAAMEAMGGMAMAMPPRAWGIATFGLTFLMWTVMMVGMMQPSAAPTILFYAALVRKNGERGTVLPAAWVFAGGYLLAWAAFSLAATVAQLALEQAGIVSAMMISTSRRVDAAIFIAAGAYQWLPAKDACLGKCRQPMQFFMTHWRGGASGTLGMGLESGAYCVGCCWAIMLLLFAGGVMNLLWVAAIAVFVLAEKAMPAGGITGRVAGVVLAAWGLILLVTS
jgi:predicted metal-binding membrane protein